MKRTLSFLLALIMVLGLASVHADEPQRLSEDEAGRRLKDWGALKGSKDGNLMKDEGLKREDAVLILIRMMGKEAEAEVTPTLPGFKDIRDRYYHPYIAFAQAQGWTEGRSKDEFGYNALVTGDEFAALMLRALGYDYKGKLYSKVGDKARELGLLEGVNMDKAGKFRRGSAFVMMFNALQQPKKDGEHKLSQILGYEKKILPSVLKLEDVRTRGLREIELFFNKAVNTPALKDIKISQSNYNIDIKDLKLMDENKRLILTLSRPALSTDKYKIKIDNIKSSDLKDTLRDEFEISMADNDKPFVAEVSALNPKLIKLNFSEPLSVQPQTTFKAVPELVIDDRQYSLKMFSSAADELLIELIDPLTVGTHRIDVSGFRDLAGNAMDKEGYDFEVADDKTPPQLLSGKFMSFNKIKLVFDEPIYDRGEFRVNEHTLKSASEVQIDEKDRRIVYLNLPRPIPYKFAVIFYWKQTDVMLNMIKDFQSYKIELEEDRTPPSVLTTNVDKTDLIITFSEAMTKNQGSYTIKQDGITLKRVTSIASTNWYDDNKLILDISNLSGDPAKPYSLVLEGFKDASLIKLDLPRYETSFQATDTKQPTAEGGYIVLEHYDYTMKTFREVKIVFSEEMDRESLEEPKNYTFRSYFDGRTTGSVRGDQADIRISSASDGKSVQIRVMEPKGWIEGVIELTGQKDRAGNFLLTKQVSKFAGGFNMINRVYVVGSPGDVSIEVEFQNPMEVLNNNSFVLRDSMGREVPLALISYEGTKALFRPMGAAFILENDGTTLDGQFVTLRLADPSAAVDIYGKTLPPNATLPVMDKLAPTVVPGPVEVQSNRRVALVFSEPMNPSSFVLKLLKADGRVATYLDGGVEKPNTVSFIEEGYVYNSHKYRKISFQTAGPMERDSYILVIAQAKDRSDNLLNHGQEQQLNFYMDK